MRFGRQSSVRSPRRHTTNDEKAGSKLKGFSYSSTSSQLSEARQNLNQSSILSKERRRQFARFWLQRGGLLILLVALLASMINVLSLSTSSRVIPLTNSGIGQSFLQSTSVYTTAADKILKSSIWNRSKITVDANSLNQRLMKEFPELANVSVTIPLLAHRPLIYIQPSQPALILANSASNFVIDTKGKALSQISKDSKLFTSLPTLTDGSGLKAKVNSQVLPANDVKFTQIVLAELAAKQYTTSSMNLPPSSSELDLHLVGQPYFVKFNLQNNDPAGQAGTFLATISELKRQNITPAQYVDVRVDGRAYYQ